MNSSCLEEILGGEQGDKKKNSFEQPDEITSDQIQTEAAQMAGTVHGMAACA